MAKDWRCEINGSNIWIYPVEVTYIEFNEDTYTGGYKQEEILWDEPSIRIPLEELAKALKPFLIKDYPCA